jgi:hypothetical protein
VSAYKEVRLFCDGKGAPTEIQPRGAACSAKFRPDPNLGFISSVVKMRAEAKRAGWTFKRYPSPSRSARSLDKDFCPEHADQATEGSKADG